MVRSRHLIATPPGATVREQLIDRGMSQKEFAVRMDMSEKHISKLINGDVQLTADMALRLETVLGVPAQFWNNLEAIYREKLVRVEREKSLEADEEIARQFPYAEMAKYGWIPETRDINEKVINLRKYFEVVELSLLSNTQITRIACRRLAVTEKSDLALMAWAQKVKLEARNVQTGSVNIKMLMESIPVIRNMTLSDPEEFSPALKKILADCGIALVFLPHLKGSFLQGATFMDGNRIVIGLTARGKDADKFWFSLFHELGHIVLGHLGHPDGTTELDENSADLWAADTLIPTYSFNEFIEEGIFTTDTVKEYAYKQGISAGIVVGRLQNEGYLKHNMLNELKGHYEIGN